MQRSAPLFAIWNLLVEERTGLHHPLEAQDLLLERISARAAEAGFESPLDYYYFLRYDPHSGPEMDALVDALTVGETYFFRELDQLQVAVARFLEPAVRAGRRPRAWSAACSTGEEPLTLAMLLDERDLLDKTDLVASDISEGALARARAGRFRARSVRDAPPPQYARHLRREADGWTVPARLREAVSWRRLNLADAADVASVGACDVILCRNVFIYFRDETVARVLAPMTRVLRPDGALFVGVSESLMRLGTSLVCEERDRVFFYRKPS